MLSVLACLAGCGAPPPPPPPPTVITLVLKTTADANASPAGVGNPLELRVYQLASPANFAAAEFFPLYNDDATALKSDLVQREKFLLPPASSKTETIKPLPTVAAVGVIAGYRDFQHVAWRVTADVVAHEINTITVTAGRAGLTVAATAAAPPPGKPGS